MYPPADKSAAYAAALAEASFKTHSRVAAS
jgi:hypothetical protein